MNVRLNKAQVLSVLLLTQLASSAHAGPNEQAKRIYERIAGEPPAAAVLGQMASAISGSPGQAGLPAAPAIPTGAPPFYNLTLENLVIPWTNRAQTAFAPFNASAPTGIHMTRVDVARSPGGDSRVFLNNCVGCHSGMDPMAQAFAYYDFVGTVVGNGTNTGSLQYTPGQVQPKYLINSTNFQFGFVTPDDSWSNRWRAGANASLGWDPTLPGSGAGAKSLGQELASSDAFAQCQVSKVFQAGCFRAPNSAADQAKIGRAHVCTSHLGI